MMAQAYRKTIKKKSSILSSLPRTPNQVPVSASTTRNCTWKTTKGESDSNRFPGKAPLSTYTCPWRRKKRHPTPVFPSKGVKVLVAARGDCCPGLRRKANRPFLIGFLQSPQEIEPVRRLSPSKGHGNERTNEQYHVYAQKRCCTDASLGEFEQIQGKPCAQGAGEQGEQGAAGNHQEQRQPIHAVSVVSSEPL